MDPLQNTNQPVPPNPKLNQDKATEQSIEKYAETLIKMVNFEYAEQHPQQTKQSKLFSTKQIVFFVIILIVAVVGTVIYKQVIGSSSPSNTTNGNTGQTKQLLHSVETFSNPSSY